MKKFILLALQLTLIQGKSFSQFLHPEKLDSFLNSLSKRGLVMGSLTISKSGITYEKVMGYAQITSTTKLLATPGTIYKIGSASKMFTAVMIFQLVEEGALILNQRLDEFFPKLPHADKITIANLLNHRSGLHNYTEGTNFEEWMDKPKTHNELLKIITEKGSDFEPGAKADYSNTNYLLLSYIIEKVCKSSYETALKKRILTTAGLTNTGFGSTEEGQNNVSTSYKYEEGSWKFVKQTAKGIHSGAGSLVSTPADMVKFLEALFSYQLITKRSLNTMKTMVDGYGMGIFPYDHGPHQGFGHNGRIEEFYTALRYFPAEKLSIAFCTNGILYPRIDILEGILKICFNESFDLPFSKTLDLKSIDLDRYTGNYSSDQVPIVVSCTKSNNKLLIETKGKIFEAEPIAVNYFMNLASGTFFEFFPDKGELQIKETDNVYYLRRK